jgi:hypothetical protein
MRVERWLILAASALFALALALPAVEGPGFPAQTGIDLLRQGAAGIRDGVVAWYANPALGLALLFGWIGANRAALGFAGVGLALALSSFSAEFVAAYAGRSVPDFAFAIGFYVWLGSFLAAGFAAGCGLRQAARSRLGATGPVSRPAFGPPRD